MTTLTAAEAFAAYEAVRHRLPEATPGKPAPTRIASLADIASDFDVFFLDAFGVLNIGDSPIEGTPDRVRALQAAGKRVLVVSNAASVTPAALQKKYARFGYDFALADIITSRMAAIDRMPAVSGATWGVMGDHDDALADFGARRWSRLGDDPDAFDRLDGVLLVGSGGWTPQRQAVLEAAVARAPCDVRVANPDIVAPREFGFSTEPGYYGHRLADRTGVTPAFFGKPFPGIFELALARVGAVDRARVVMVGDSLHTDVLGAHAAGLASVLISDWGFFAGQDVGAAIARSGIVPDYIAARP